MKTVERKYWIPFLLVSLLFMLWGVANNMNDTLLAAFKRIMSMSDLQTSLVQFAFYGAYFCFALPAALFIMRFNYKTGILVGLVLYALGTLLFYPAGQAASYPFFLFAIYVMAGGCSILETTANPYILSMGSRESATRRLNIAQTFNPIGAIGGILLSRHFILSELHEAGAEERSLMSEQALMDLQRHELDAVSGTYMIIGGILLVLFIVILLAKMPKDRDDSDTAPLSECFSHLWRNPNYRNGVVAQFFYVGVQTCVWSFTIRYVMAETGSLEKEASLIFLYSIVAFTAFRFFFTWLMKFYRPATLLFLASILGIILTGIVIVGSGTVSIVALIGISAVMSLMFPTIYGIALGNVEERYTKIGASGLIMAILGGAVLTPLQALISDAYGISLSFILPAFCFLVIMSYGIYNLKVNKTSLAYEG
ncbi:MAG: L-fucose:H+ symporter permease [Muribaculaceae bacterium]|nr:L-fucose:H+ symporter permease [Muribaculaceae bacterium]